MILIKICKKFTRDWRTLDYESTRPTPKWEFFQGSGMPLNTEVTKLTKMDYINVKTNLMLFSRLHLPKSYCHPS